MEQKVNKMLENQSFSVEAKGLNAAEATMLAEAKRLDQLTDEIKQEAKSRILEILPEYKQRNLLMRAFRLLMHFKQTGQFTKSETRLWLEVQDSWREVDVIRQVSDELENLAEDGRLPDNWKEDICWR